MYLTHNISKIHTVLTLLENVTLIVPDSTVLGLRLHLNLTTPTLPKCSPKNMLTRLPPRDVLRRNMLAVVPSC